MLIPIIYCSENVIKGGHRKAIQHHILCNLTIKHYYLFSNKTDLQLREFNNLNVME